MTEMNSQHAKRYDAKVYLVKFWRILLLHYVIAYGLLLGVLFASFLGVSSTLSALGAIGIWLAFYIKWGMKDTTALLRPSRTHISVLWMTIGLNSFFFILVCATMHGMAFADSYWNVFWLIEVPICILINCFFGGLYSLYRLYLK